MYIVKIAVRSGVLRNLGEVGPSNSLMHYTYILQSQKDQSYDVGVTSSLKRRYQEHNSGGVRYTKSKMPWSLVWFGSFVEKERAVAFEIYLKSSSGHAFRNKRLI